MKSSVLYTLFSESLLKAISWTLIDSIWVGIISALFTGLILFITRRARPHIRYNLLLVTLGLTVGCLAMAFVRELRIQPVWTREWNVPTDTTITFYSPGHDVLTAGAAASLWERLTSFLNENAALIVACWLIIILVKCLLIVRDIAQVRLVSRRQVYPAGQLLDQRLEELALQLGVHRPVKVLHSAVTRIPVVVRYFKPAILLPIGLCTSLSQAEVEAILIHELAHIRRHDYMVNLLQCFVEAVFFFNPAILWISSLLRVEREKCCDDIVISRTENKRNYVEALLAFQQYSLETPQLAPAFAGRRGQLLTRVKRIVFNTRTRSLNTMEKAFLICIFLLASVVTISLAQIQKNGQQPATAQQQDPLFQLSQDPSKVAEGTACKIEKIKNGVTFQTFYFKKKGVLYQIDRRNNVTLGLAINGKKVADADIAGYTQVYGQLIRDYNSTMARQQGGVKEDEELHKRPDIAPEDAELHKHPDVVPEDKELHKRPDIVPEDAELHKRPDIVPEDAELHKRPDIVPEDAELHKRPDNPQEDEEVKKFMDGVVAALKQEKVIQTEAGLSFKLDHKALIVNGVKEPESVRAKFDKFLGNDPSSVLVYRFKE